MIIEFECRHCKSKLRAENSITKPVAICPVCDKNIIVPKKIQHCGIIKTSNECVDTKI
jgi:hypothetical protein